MKSNVFFLLFSYQLSMDAVVVLCHFCEIHGPAVIMCTQPLRQMTAPLLSSRKTSVGTPHASSSCGSFHITSASTSASHEGTIWPGDQHSHNAFCKLTCSPHLLFIIKFPLYTWSHYGASLTLTRRLGVTEKADLRYR